MARKVTLEIRARNALKKGLSEAGAALQNFGRSAVNIGKMFAKAFIGAGAAIAGFAAKALHAYSQQEKAEQAVIASLNAHGEAGRELLPMYQRLAAAIQDETGVADENTLARMAQLRMLGVTTDQMEQATKATIALERAGMAEQAAIRAVAAAQEGSFEALTRYIPALRTAADETEKAAIVNDFLSKSYDAQKSELDTVSGQWNLLKGRIGDVWEEIGRAIAQNDALMGALKRAGEAVKAFGERVTAWASGGGMTNLIAGFRYFYEEARLRFQLIGNAAHIAFSAIGDSFETAWKYISGVAVAGADVVTGSFRRIGDVGAAVFLALLKPSREAFRGIAQAASDAASSAVADMHELGKALAGENTSTTARTQAALAAREAYHQESAERVAKIGEWQMQQLAGSAESAADAEISEIERVDIARENSAKKAADLAKQIEQAEKELADRRKKDAQDQVAALQREIAAKERVAAQTVAAFIAERQAGKDAAKALEDDAKKAEKLKEKEARGIRLSRRDREFLSAFGQIEAARGGKSAAQQQLDRAQAQLAEMQDQSRTLHDIDRHLADMRQDMAKLMVAQ